MSRRISYIVPIDYMTGNLSGRQELDYVQGDGAYAAPDGQKTSATNYEPRLIAKRRRPNVIDEGCNYFQVRTKTSVNMTAAMRLNMAVMGGAGALFASLLRDKSAQIYAQCAAATPKGISMRAFIVPLLKAGLAAKSAQITIADNIYIVNPWISEDVPNVPIPIDIYNKFLSVLSNPSPYNEITSEYLQNTYPDYWQDIVEYGNANRSCVQYINEDPDLICSLIDVGYTRWLEGDRLAWINTECALYYSNNWEIVYDTYLIGLFNYQGILSFFQFTSSYEIWADSAGYFSIRWGGTKYSTKIDANTRHNIRIIRNNNDFYVYIDNELKINFNKANVPGDDTYLYDLCFPRNSIGMQRHYHVKFTQNDVIVRDMYPFIRNNVPGMIDLLTGSFYANANDTGAFTISKVSNN